MIESGFWNGQPTEIERGTAEVVDVPEVAAYWARAEGIVGERIPVVRVVLDGVNFGGGTAYLDDRQGVGYAKVMAGGSPRVGHRDVAIATNSFAPLAAPDAADGMTTAVGTARPGSSFFRGPHHA